MHQVRDMNRILQFEGDLVSHSTSWRQGSQRWVEFFLYRTESGSYVLSRVGHSLLFHRTECAIAKRNNLKLSEVAGLDKHAVGCDICKPDLTSGTVCAEEPRYWAQVCHDADSVIEACWKYDENGTHYLTLVARRMLDEASKQDENIEAAYLVEYVN